MASSNYTQTSFLGGEWSPWAQGRFDKPAYRTALSLCLNGFPVEEGAWVRRPGFVDLGCTHKNLPARLWSFNAGGQFATAASQGRTLLYLIEVARAATDQHIRLWIAQDGEYPTLLTEAAVGTITSFSSASPTLMTMSAAQTWVTGDTILITVNSGAAANAADLRGRQFIVTKVSTTTFTLVDAATGDNVDGSTISYTAATAVAKEIVVLTTSINNSIHQLRLLQSGTNVIMFDWAHLTWLLTISADATPVVTLGTLSLVQADGPYLDPLPGTSQTDNKTATATTSDGLTYHITIGSDGAAFSFVSTDTNRCFRIWTQPAAWDASTTYNTGDTVTYNDTFWTARPQLGAATITAGVAPGQPVAVTGVNTFPWVLTPNLGRWTSSYISAFTDANEVDVRIADYEETNPLVRLTIDAWQIGVYNGVLHPATGGWCDGRLFLGGALNRVDASVAGAFESFVAGERGLFSPTDIYGSVNDDLAISGVINSRDSASALWFEQDQKGMIFGTGNGEWLVSAGDNGIMTPTATDVRKLSDYKAAFVDPLRIGSTLIFPQAAGSKIYEYLVDAVSNRYRALPLNASAQHLAEENGGVQELAYQDDPTPIVWATTGTISADYLTRTAGTVLLGCTYRRASDFATVPPEYNGWHQHTHGAGRAFYSIAVASIYAGQEALAAVTYDSTDTVYRVEVMSRVWGPSE